MNKNKQLEDMSFEELVDYVTMRIHLGLLEGGGKGMKSTVHMWLSQTIVWSQGQKCKSNT